MDFNNLYRYIFLLFILVFNTNTGFSQDDLARELLQELEGANEDTNKVVILNDLCWEFTYIDYEKSIAYGNRGIQLAKKLNYATGLQDAYRYTARTYATYGENEDAIKGFQKALDVNVTDERGVGLIHNDIACVYDNMAEFVLALEHYYKALRIFEKLDFTAAIGMVKVNMINIYVFQSDYTKALKLSEEAYELYDAIGDPISAGVAMFNKGVTLTALKEYEKANESLTLALNIFEEEGDIEHKSEVLNSFGSLQQELGNLEQALDYYTQSLEIDDSLGNQLWVAKSYSNISGIYYALNEYDKAVEYDELALATAKEAGDLQWFMTTIGYLAEDYYQNGQHELAHEYRLFYDRIKDSIYSESQSNQILELTEQYETEKKDQEIINLKKIQEVSSRENKLYYSILGVSILALLFVVFSILLYLRNQKSKSKILQYELKQIAFRAQMNPHFIFNSLNSIQRMYIEGKEDIANDYMADFSRLLRGILENSGKSKIQLNEEVEITKLYLDLERMRTDKLFDYKFEIDDKIDLLGTMIPPLIFQPYVENAIWHGIMPQNESGMIEISIKKKNDKELICEIKDSGVGIDLKVMESQNSNKFSKGMEITSGRLGGNQNVQVESGENKGTKITLTIQI